MIKDFIIKEKVLLIIILFFVCLLSAISLNSKLMYEPDNDKYTKAMELYRGEDYQNSYYNFSKISYFSEIKPASIFRQARCATLIGDTKTAIKNYNILLKRFPKSPLYAVSEYNLATLLYESDNQTKALKHFRHIQKKFPESEFAIASKYYIGLITNDTKLLLEYIALSPKGRFAQDAIELIKDKNLSSNENYTIANSCLEREEYKEGEKYFHKTDISQSWAKYALNEFKLNNNETAKQLVIKGLKDYSNNVNKEEVYNALDAFVAQSANKPLTLSILINTNPNAQGVDYLYYILAGNSSKDEAYKLYKKLYTKYPSSKFSADSMAKVFYNKIDQRRYDDAIKLGKQHLANYGNTNSAPAVMYWLGKTYERKQQPDMAKMYYRGLLKEYPDSYYALKSHSKLHGGAMFSKYTISEKPVVFPVKNASNMKFAIRLAQLGDNDFVKELYKDDMFVQSWVEYNKGNYTNSALIAREAMKSLPKKPDYSDTRWRLVYPLHYYHYVKTTCKHINPIIIMAIVKEESHFNPKAESSVGALGLMQLMPQTAKEISASYGIPCDLFTPKTNIQLGCLYYSKIKQGLNDKDTLAILAYNGGIGSVKTWQSKINYFDSDDFIEKIPYPETQEYVKKVLKAYWNYSNIY